METKLLSISINLVRHWLTLLLYLLFDIRQHCQMPSLLYYFVARYAGEKLSRIT